MRRPPGTFWHAEPNWCILLSLMIPAGEAESAAADPDSEDVSSDDLSVNKKGLTIPPRHAPVSPSAAGYLTWPVGRQRWRSRPWSSAGDETREIRFNPFVGPF